MKKTLFITVTSNKNDLKKLLETTIESMEDITIQSFQDGDTLVWISRERPKIIVIDGNLETTVAKYMYEDISNTIGTYDINCNMFLINQPLRFPGAPFIKNLNELDSLRKD